MPRIVMTEDCENCRECVEVCPMLCFHDAESFVVINADECVDCSLCEDACPSKTIVNHEDHHEQYAQYLEKNMELTKKYPKAM